ncbi:MAG: hypothetical protein UZ21_OP11001000063 [Microgenomates bacterium OLB22]|nr:MAG: hypothetical protein UZ21_OP11001000063 [Microgenomates bacterium OLB22]
MMKVSAANSSFDLILLINTELPNTIKGISKSIATPPSKTSRGVLTGAADGNPGGSC